METLHLAFTVLPKVLFFCLSHKKPIHIPLSSESGTSLVCVHVLETRAVYYISLFALAARKLRAGF